MHISPQFDESTYTARYILLALLKSQRLRFSVVSDNQPEVLDSYVSIHPDDILALQEICRTLPQVRLVRTLCNGGEIQVILEDIEDGKRAYSCLTFIPEWRREKVRSNGLTAWSRSLGAWLRPNGLFCVVLGPDGVGKSTTIDRLQRELQTLFGPCTKQRWRPGLIRKIKPDTTNRMPHAKSMRGGATSSMNVVGLAMDFSIGYALWAYPKMARSETIVFDRYFHDLLIDSKRYRYAGPAWLPRLLARFIPPRDALFIILDAADEVILSRKQELPADELKRQRTAYRAFAAQAKHSVIISTEKPVKDIVTEIVDEILKHLASKDSLNANAVL